MCIGIALNFQDKKCIFPHYFPFQSGSQNDLCDTWTPEEEAEAEDLSSRLCGSAGAAAAAATAVGPGSTPGTAASQQPLSAEYPFHMNLCMPPQGINFDLTYKRGKKETIVNTVGYTV